MRILIADDDSAVILLLQSTLEEWGYEVVAVSDGTAAWDVLQSPDAPQLALLDWMMPGLDGVEVCRRVRQMRETRSTYLVLLTGKSKTEDIVKGIEAGADDFVSKPFKEQELKVRLRAGQRIVELHAVLLKAATHDELTGLWNRKAIIEFLEREVERAIREGNPLGLIIADIDHFKQFNDSFGHQYGDTVMREIARRMSAPLRRYDAVGRYGGEEFLVVLPGCDLANAVETAERMRRLIVATGLSSPTGTVPITVSFGAASSQGAEVDTDELIRLADDALYRAKRCGRNRVEAAIGSKLLVELPDSPTPVVE